MKEINDIYIDNYKLTEKNKLLFIGGPCVIESENMVFNIAEELKKITSKLGINFVFKASYDKANRTSINAYRGPGIDKGLKILRKLKNELNLFILTDVHCKEDVNKVAEVADIIQIPAFLSRQTDLITAAAKTGKVINIKKGQFLSPESVKFIYEKIETAGNKNIMITERGVSFGYGRLIVDFAGIPIMREYGYPVIFDATHSVQLPSTGDNKTGGNRKVIPYLVNAAMGAGCDGLFMEIHPDPDNALSDKASQFYLDKVDSVLKTAVEIFNIVRDELK